MLRIFLTIALSFPMVVSAEAWFDGDPDFENDSARKLALEVLDAHGGMAAMHQAASLKFEFFTKVIGAQIPFYSTEALDLETGAAYVEWPFWDATIAWNKDQVWSHRWPMPMPAGFFVRLTSSFITLPWQIHADGVGISGPTKARLPEDDTDYQVLKIKFDQRNPGIPGTYYELFIDPETHLMKAIGFDINHPGMVANPNQPLGPNYHVFDDYKNFQGLIIPTFYKSYGRNGNRTSNAYHFVWNLQIDQPFDRQKLIAPENAVPDRVSVDWWQGNTE